MNSNNPGLVSVEANEVLLALQVYSDAQPVTELTQFCRTGQSQPNISVLVDRT